MSDFLQTLIARNSLNAPSVAIQPRLPALFESMDAANGPSQSIETTEEQTGAAQTSSMTGFQPETEVRTNRSDSTFPPQPDLQLGSETPFNPKRNQVDPTDELAALDQEATKTIRLPEMGSIRQPIFLDARIEQNPALPEAGFSTSVRPQDTIVPLEHADANLPRTPQSGVFNRPAFLPTPQVSKPTSTRQAQANSVESAEQETTVRVHIGRIEVRAVTAPAPSQAVQRLPKSKPTLSLDDYLKQRSERKR